MTDSLIARMKDGTADDIDNDMFKSHLVAALKDFSEAVKKVSLTLKEFTEKHESEAKILGVHALVSMGIDSRLQEQPMLQVVLGGESKVMKGLMGLLQQIKGDNDSKTEG